MQYLLTADQMKQVDNYTSEYFLLASPVLMERAALAVCEEIEKRFSDIYDTTIAGVRYYRCKKDGYWGLYDTKFNEVIAPDFEDLSVFSGTNFIKFKLNGFWGVMTLQGRVTKTIIPTTRGYTNISRYIKSQKRFTYEMNGYHYCPLKSINNSLKHA